jgi:hypothetical protein
VYSEAWIERVSADTPSLTEKQKRHRVIGRVTGDNFEVSLLTDDAADSAAQVIYFNPDGSKRREPWGVSDGGYLIVGLEPGLHTVVVSPERSAKKVTHLVISDDRAVHYSFTNLLN